MNQIVNQTSNIEDLSCLTAWTAFPALSDQRFVLILIAISNIHSSLPFPRSRSLSFWLHFELPNHPFWVFSVFFSFIGLLLPLLISISCKFVLQILKLGFVDLISLIAEFFVFFIRSSDLVIFFFWYMCPGNCDGNTGSDLIDGFIVWLNWVHDFEENESWAL